MKLKKRQNFTFELTKRDLNTLNISKDMPKISMKNGQEKSTIIYWPTCSSKTVTNSNIYLFNAPSIKFQQGKKTNVCNTLCLQSYFIG